MRKLVVIEFLSLDGVMQAPGDPSEDTEGGFRHGGWQLPYFDDVQGEAAGEGMAATDAHLFGRKTYETMAGFWPTAPADDPFAAHLNTIAKYVASTTLRQEDLKWQNSTLLTGEVAEEVAKLKELPGKNIAVLGSGQLVQTLIKHGLVDEYNLTVCPIVIGSGKRLFRDSDQPTKLKLVDSKPTPTGCLMLTYQPA
ncbi:MAG: dihydrofolate reductase family protein [Actinomycetota bacterium]